MAKTVLIIGAGIGGLAAGCYSQMNGYNSHIFEMHDKPGGLCTAWTRKGYTIDGCLHWLSGSSPDSEYYHFWQELGMVQNQQIIDMDQFYRIELPGGKAFTLYTDIDRLEKHMLELAPEDARTIHRMAGALRDLRKFMMPADKAPDLFNPFDTLGMLIKIAPFMGVLRTWGKLTLSDLGDKFQNPDLKYAFKGLLIPELSAMAILITLAWMHRKAAGYVIGGSMQLSRAIEKRYLGLGGQIRYQSRVSQILVENDRAVGVKLSDNAEIRADYVISAADGYATIFEMLQGKYINDRIRSYYATLPIFQPLVYIGLGVNRTFSEIPKIVSGILLPLEPAAVLGGQTIKILAIRIHNFDPGLAPQGKTVITCMIDSRYKYWETLKQEPAAYVAEKNRIADYVISVLDKRFPGLAKQVEMRDVSTPLTFRRYTGNWQGSFEGWMATPSSLTLQMKKTLPGLDGFYMVGQWVQPGGGLPSGVMTGSWVVQMMCKKDHKKFVVSLPPDS